MRNSRLAKLLLFIILPALGLAAIGLLARAADDRPGKGDLPMSRTLLRSWLLTLALAGMVLAASCRQPVNKPQPAPATAAANAPAASAAPEFSLNGKGDFRMAQTAMGTTFQYIVVGVDKAQASKAVSLAMTEVARLEGLMSDTRPDSDVSRINQSAGGPPVPVAPEVYAVIEHSLEMSKLSNGGFDITVGALKGVWVINKAAPRVPTADEIKARLPLIDWHNVIMDPGRRAVGLKLPGMRIDLGGIAKGYAVDAAAEILKRNGITMATVDAGGNLRLLGAHGQRPWNVGIQHPRDPNDIIAWMRLTDVSVSTSGDYEQFIQVNGRRYCHIIDPHTGIPVEGTKSVTVVTAEAWRADGLSTAVFVLGPKKGMALIESLPGVEGVIIDVAGQRFVSSGLVGRVKWIDEEK